jgi:glycosyltransferase involved in cell wall biosynthesis
MTISVIIATYNRAALLDECLDHLSRQHFSDGDEVIVVDNGSNDETPDVIRRARGRFTVPLRHLEEPRPGKSHALTRALSEASGDVLAFTDDDVDAEPDWLDAIRAAMDDPATALVGGPVAPRWETNAPRWLGAAVDSYGRLAAPLALLNYGPTTVDLGPRTVLGANLAVRRDVLVRLGGFATHLGKLRGTLLSGEDHELCRRVQAAGFQARYCPGARVRHWVPASRMRLGYYLSWFFWSGITNAALEADEAARGRALLGVPLYLFKRAAAAGARGAAAAVVGNVKDAAEHAIDVAFVAGYASQRVMGKMRPARP